MGPPTGAIIVGSPNVSINRRAASRVLIGVASCSKGCGAPQPEATGAATVFINGQPAGRVDEQFACSAKIVKGSENVFIGGPSVQALPMTPEVPAWLNASMQIMAIGGMVIAMGGVWATYGVGAALAGLGGRLLGG